MITYANKLPDLCAATLPSDGSPIYIKRGEDGFWHARSNLDVNAFNQVLGVSPAQREAMLAGSMFGWTCPGSDPDRYDADGKPISKRKRAVVS